MYGERKMTFIGSTGNIVNNNADANFRDYNF